MKAYYRILRRSVVMAILACLWCMKALPATEPYQQQIQGQLKKGDTLVVKDEKFENPAYDWSTIRNNLVTNVITFGLYRDSAFTPAKPFKCKIDLKVVYWSQPDQEEPITIEHVPLEIGYDTTEGAIYQAQAFYEFRNAYKIKITINDISSAELGELPPVFSLAAQVIVDREYVPKSMPDLIPSVFVEESHDNEGGDVISLRSIGPVTAGPDKVSLIWEGDPAMHQYDLEWTFIDEESDNGRVLNTTGETTPKAQLEKMFLNNSTRITTDKNSYDISLVHNSKFLLLRMRGVKDSSGFRVERPWSYEMKKGTSTVSAVVILSNTWHLPAQNWQYSAAYAEDGKRKEVVSYFDGTLRNRQTVTVDRSTGTAVVKENIYDEFGRPVADILPAPQRSGNLKYFPSLHKDEAGNIYTAKNIFRSSELNCSPRPDPMSTDTGASRYYSPKNDFMGAAGYNKYIPDAEKYPFAVTAYTPDNTGRISVKGGVGAAMQPENGTNPNHTTRYYYGKPLQWELDRLFGNDAGYDHHYLKNMVIDPNGQISVSYVNASGKTVATALTGTSPDTALLGLENKPAPVVMDVPLLEPDNFVFDPSTLKITGTTTYLASVPDARASLRYTMSRLIKKYQQNNVTICSNCFYTMDITVMDDCRTQVAGKKSVVLGSRLSDCNAGGTFDTTFVAPLNKIGAYYITFELRLSPDVITDYTNDFIDRNTNLRTRFQFILDELKQQDFTGCFADCQTCKTALGSKYTFTNGLKLRLISLGVDTLKDLALINTWSNGLYDALYSNCQASRSACLLSACDELKQQLMKDVSPGGQYALFDQNRQPLEKEQHVLYNNWRTVFPPKAATDPIYIKNIFRTPEGSELSPNDGSFTLNKLQEYWQPEWAELFIGYHPEKCALDFCNANGAYLNWDKRVQQVYTSTIDIPEIKAGLSYQLGNAAWLADADPYFAAGATGADQLSAFKADLNAYSTRILNYSDNRINAKSLTQYVDYRLYCETPGTTANTNKNTSDTSRWNRCLPDASCRIPDREWQLYRELYFALKERYYQAKQCKPACPIGQPAAPGESFLCDEAASFSIVKSSRSTCGGKQTITIRHIGGPVKNTTTLSLYYPMEYKDLAVVNSIVLPKGVTEKDTCIDAGIDAGVVKVSMASCSGVVLPPVWQRLSCMDFSSGDFDIELTGSNNVYRVKYLKFDTKPIPKGITITVEVHVRTYKGELVRIDHFKFTEGTRSLLSPPSETILLQDGPIIQSCTGNDERCSTIYSTKISRTGTIKTATEIPSDTSILLPAFRDQLKSSITTNCTSMADAWMSKLYKGLQAAGVDTTKRKQLRDNLIAVCSQGGDLEHPFGASTNAAGTTSFGAVIKSVLGLSAFTMTLNPWLLESPYPYSVKAQTTDRMVNNTDSLICVKLNNLKAEHTSKQPGVSFFAYLSSKYGSGMNITETQLNRLLKGCTNCRYLLEDEVKLPVFLDGKTTGCITGADLTTAENDLKTQMGAALITTHENYEGVYATFMNHRWGFTMSYAEYEDFKKELVQYPARLLCNKPAYSTVPLEPYECLYQLFDDAVATGSRKYDNYIDSVKLDFRNHYIKVCGAAAPLVKLKTSQQIYHYTLYYYDQAGNLLRTVPPEGVDFLDAASLPLVEKARNADYSNCSFSGPQNNTDITTTLNNLSNTLSGANQSVEMWLYNMDRSATQLTTVSGGNRHFMNICIDGNFLRADIYKLTPPSDTIVDIIQSNHVDVNISSLLPLNPWTHVVLQGSGLDGGSPVTVYVNGQSLPVVASDGWGGCGWDIISTAGKAQFTQELSNLKQLRMYTRLLSGAEITANAKESCMGLAPAYSTALTSAMRYWGRFNTPTAGSPTTLPDGGTTEVQTPSVFPKHRLATAYAYNALNQVVRQSSPDAKDSYFWYDRLGRLFASQNSKQQAITKQYSYTIYDALGRITEVGEKSNATILGAPAFMDNATVNGFLASGTNAQITRTLYDVSAGKAGINQDNLRKRVAASTYYETTGAEEQATYYSYDLSGNVKTLWQKMFGLHEIKQVDYNYDLISGKVNAVAYQRGKPDQFLYNYLYDDENRLIEAQTSIATADGKWKLLNKRTDALYTYYKHGPLARMVIGENTVQGLDYAYTLHGWLKGINSHYLLPASDIGSDGLAGAATATVGRDVIGFSLDYYKGDYKPVNATAAAFPLQWQGQAGDQSGQDLFNGNISRSTLAISKLNSANPVGYTYRYDQLNRLLRMRQHRFAAGATTWGMAQAVADFKEDIRYDANGNILQYLRYGTRDTSYIMDSLTYFYQRDAMGLTSNRLNYIYDSVPANIYKTDIDRQTIDNYLYDNTGNLINDKQAGITIGWSVYGKIRTITNSADNSSLLYKYDASGNRVYKEYKKGSVINKTWYVRDAQGNVLAVYGNKNGDANTYWQEQHLYGSSRLGMWQPAMLVTANTATTLWGQEGLKSYELTNHLGNVLATVSDKKPVYDAAAKTNVADVTMAVDYAPFGMQMVGRKWNGARGYRYGFNGKEKDDEVKGDGNQYDYGFRIYNPQIGRFLSVDPLFKSYPYYTPYQFAGNKPIWATDLDGLEERYYQLDIVIGKNNVVKSVSNHEIKAKSAGWHLYSGYEGVKAYNNPVGKFGIGDQFSISISKELVDGTASRIHSELFISRKQTWFESVFSSQKGAQRGGGIVFTSSQAGDGIKGAGSQNKFEPTAANPDGKMESIDLVLDAMSMAKNAIEAESLQVPEGVLESIELVKKNLDLFDAGSKAGGVIDGILPESNKPVRSRCLTCEGEGHELLDRVRLNSRGEVIDTIKERPGGKTDTVPAKKRKS